MSKNYVIGFPRIGEKRELKKVLEQYWLGEIDFLEVEFVSKELKKDIGLIKKVQRFNISLQMIFHIMTIC